MVGTPSAQGGEAIDGSEEPDIRFVGREVEVKVALASRRADATVFPRAGKTEAHGHLLRTSHPVRVIAVVPRPESSLL